MGSADPSFRWGMLQSATLLPTPTPVGGGILTGAPVCLQTGFQYAGDSFPLNHIVPASPILLLHFPFTGTILVNQSFQFLTV